MEMLPEGMYPGFETGRVPFVHLVGPATCFLEKKIDFRDLASDLPNQDMIYLLSHRLTVPSKDLINLVPYRTSLNDDTRAEIDSGCCQCPSHMRHSITRFVAQKQKKTRSFNLTTRALV